MKAWRYSSLVGNLEDSLKLDPAVPVPSANTLQKDQLLVKVISASLNPVDYKLPESGFIGRASIPHLASPGLDFCGHVVGKHPSNTDFEEGQIVFGGLNSPQQMGTLGEYTVVSSQCCAILPQGVSPNHAAAVGTAATTAYQSLMPDTLPPAATVFVNGGSGGVGTWTIQLAKAMGAKVVTTCSALNVELCRRLGADEVIDYREVDLLTNLKDRGPIFDLFIDNVGNQAALYTASSSFIKPGGTFVQVGVGATISMKSVALLMTKQIVPSVFLSRKFYFVNMKNSSEYFQKIGSWMADGKVRSIIEAEYGWEDVPEAFRRLRMGHAAGKIVITGWSLDGSNA